MNEEELIASLVFLIENPVSDDPRTQAFALISAIEFTHAVLPWDVLSRVIQPNCDVDVLDSVRAYLGRS